MSDLINREDAIEALDFEIVHMTAYCNGTDYGNLFAKYNKGLEDGIKAIRALPSAEPECQEFEWCHDCKEYDQEKHCCHRWTKVIRQTVEEVKNSQWIPVTESLPEEETIVLVTVHYDGDKYYRYKPNDYVTTAEYISDRWCFADEEFIMQLHKHHVIAWAPLPKPWEG